MRLFKKLRQKLTYLPPEQFEQVYQAYLIALGAHQGQKRSTGDDYITHPVLVATILAEMHMDYQTIVSALLHDVIEDTEMTKEEIKSQFGESVANLVDGVSKLTKIEFVTRAEAQAESFRKMVLAMANDIRVIIVKLADRLHNMRTLSSLPLEKQKRISHETLEIYAPIAKRLGMREFSVELEELGFVAAYPMRCRILKDAVHKSRGNHKKILSLIEKTLHEGISKNHLPSCVIMGREKNLYSIYKKMRNRHVPFDEIMDVYAFRIIVNNIDTCYRVLGVVHNLFKPVPEKFKDYIAIPKANGYQSLHTILFGPYGLPIEMQIRTTEMDKIATSGIAAHWLYKSDEQSVEKSQVRTQEWMHNLLELQENAGSSLEFVESVKVDLFPDEIYVFTPKGDIMQLPAQATAIDFAYTVHTDIGNRCVAVKINRQLAPLSSALKNGQTIEVVTSTEGRPSPTWLDFVATSKARSGIRHFLKNQQHSESIHLGKELLKKALDVYSLNFKKISDNAIQRLLTEIHQSDFDAVLSEIGLGNRVPALVAQRLASLMAGESTEVVSDQAQPLLIKGTEGTVVNFAICCHPIPGDPIVGVLDAGRGIVVHVEDCFEMSRLRDRSLQSIPLRWSDEVTGEFTAIVRAQVINERGVLALLASAIAEKGGNISDIRVKDQDGHYYMVIFTLLISDRKHLAGIIRQLRKIKQVIKIARLRSAA